MSRVRGLELLFNLEQKNIKSKEDCVIAALHCVLINENYECVGTGDDWPETENATTELLPRNWNSNQDMYSLRYSTKDKKFRILLKATKMEHILQIDAVMNEDEVIASLPIIVNDCISENFREYSSAYKDLESLVKSFREVIVESINQPKEKEKEIKSKLLPSGAPVPPRVPRPSSSPFSLEEDPRSPFQPRIPNSDFDPLRRTRYPRIGGSDLDPLGGAGGGGMFMDPSSFGIPSRPTLPEFGVGGPGGLPRGAVPPGARFDPFMPPIRPPNRSRNPNPDHYPPPDFDDYM